MATIKEIAEDYAADVRGEINNQIAYQACKYGANAVLEQVDYILMDRDLDCEETCDSLFELIEQLKE